MTNATAASVETLRAAEMVALRAMIAIRTSGPELFRATAAYTDAIKARRAAEKAEGTRQHLTGAEAAADWSERTGARMLERAAIEKALTDAGATVCNCDTFRRLIENGCAVCNPRAWVKCSACNGRGTTGRGSHEYGWEGCPACNGSGYEA